MTPRTLPTFRFDQFTLRPAGESDLELARTWTSEDPHHAGRIAPEFWLQQGKGEEAWVLEDGEGPVFFFHMQQTVKALIQFGPSRTREQRERTQVALMGGVAWLGALLGQVGKHEVVFDSQSPALKLFCEKRLGFNPTPDMLTKTLFVK